jgi:DNA polymerase-1
VDNIPGCPGVGEKTAQKLVAQFGSIEGLLEHSDQLKGALKTKVETNREQIQFSKFLATIKTDVPIELNMDQLRKEAPNEEEIRRLFDELEFKNLADRVLKTEKKVAAPKANSNPLFPDLFADEGTEEEKYSILASLKTVRHKYHLVESEEDIEQLLRILAPAKIISLDTETTSATAMEAELVGMSFSVLENEAYYVPVPADPQQAQALVDRFRPIFEKEEVLKVGQNIKYDLLVLRHYGVQLAGPMFDTMIAHYVLQPELHHGMDYLAEIYLKYETVKIEELIGPKGKKQKNMRDLSPTEVYEYACEDADVTLKLKNVLEQEIRKNDCESLFYEMEMPLVPVLAEMEWNGVTLDTESLKQTSLLFTQRMQQLEEEIYALAGEPFNISSPKQVGEVLFDKLKLSEKAKKTKGKGQYITSEEVLEGLRHKHEIVGKILDYRGLKKLLGTYIDALPALINPRTHKIHTSFNQAITATGRLSSSNPNLQNIPVRNEDGKEIRKAFVAEEGCEFFSADYSQIELRIMAHLSEDANMMEAFRSGYDVHAATAAKVFKKEISEVTREERSKAKTANFGIIYGISVFGLAERMEVSRKEAAELIDGYFATYPDVKKYMEKSIQVAKERGYIETLFKRKRFLPDINSGNAVVRGYAERNAINAPIQGSAADIIKVAMVQIYRRFREEGIRSKMILQVHDELNFSVYPDEKERVERIVLEEMERAYPLRVPLVADSGWGKNWLEAH